MPRFILIFFLVLTSCAPAVVQAPPPVTPPAARLGAAPSGDEINRVHLFCVRQATLKCPRATIGCDAFRRAYVKSCLVEWNVPPDYISVLLAR